MKLPRNSIKAYFRTLKSSAPIILGLTTLVLTAVYFRLSFSQYAVHFAAEFEKQNVHELGNSDVLSITNRLNATLPVIPWVCIEASRNNIPFFVRTRGNCTASLTREVVVISSLPTGDLQIKAVLTFPDDLRDDAVLFFIVQSFMLYLILRSQKKLDLVKYEGQINLVELAKQVSHDIRSPLSALEMLSSVIGELPEEKRTILRNSINRIRDIANSLLHKDNEGVTGVEARFGFSLFTKDNKSSIELENNEPELLYPIIDTLITEKRIQFRDQLNIQIEFNQTQESYGIFSRIKINELKTVISNLINNSVEALYDNCGRIDISLRSVANKNILEIIDNGRGVPVEISRELGKKGVSFGKKTGSGLGLFHAINTIKSWNGQLDIDSTDGKGTVVTLMLPKEEPAIWFVPKLILKVGAEIIILDDDQSIHQIWKKRIEIFRNSGTGFSIQNLSSPEQFRFFFRKNYADLESATFLIDYEFLNHSESGLDLIEQFGIQKQSILVTSRFEENIIRERCERLAVKLIPKSMSGFIPIEVFKS